MKTANTKAVRLDTLTAYTALEVRDINRVSKLLTKFGAVSAERAAKLTKQSTMSAAWCLLQLGAVPAGGLYIWEVV